MKKLSKYISENYLGGRQMNSEMRGYFNSLCGTYGEDMLISFLKSKQPLFLEKKYKDDFHLLNTFKLFVSRGIASYSMRCKKEAMREKTKVRPSIYMPDCSPEKREQKNFDIL